MSIGRRSRKQVDAVREAVFERDGQRCVAYGFGECAGVLTVQHSVARGMGGSAKYDGIDFLRAMCAHHNTLDTADAAFHERCVKRGWSVPRWLADSQGIQVIPVLYSDGWHLLQNGERIRISDDTARTIWDELGI